MIILVTGDRNWDDIELMWDVLSLYDTTTTLVHGYASGADSIAHVIGLELGFVVVPCPAHWRHNTPKWVEVYGRCDIGCEHVSGAAAGAIRNRYMLRTHRPRRVLAFHNDLSQSKGTRDMVNISRLAGIHTEHYTRNGLKSTFNESLTN